MALRPRVAVPVTVVAAAVAAVLGGLAGSAWFGADGDPAEVVTVQPVPSESRVAPPAAAAPVLTAPPVAEPVAEPAPEPPAQPVGQAELVPAIEDRVLALANEARAAAGIAPLERMSELDAVARGWSTTLATQGGDLAHNPDYTAEIPGGWSAAAENVAWMGETRVVPADGVAVTIHQGWMDSAGHRENLLNPGYTRIGVGVAFSPEHGYYLTQNFATY